MASRRHLVRQLRQTHPGRRLARELLRAQHSRPAVRHLMQQMPLVHQQALRTTAQRQAQRLHPRPPVH